MRFPIHQTLWVAEVALTNAHTDAEIGARLALFGYADARLQEGVTLYRAALARQQEQQALQGQRLAATDAMQKAWEAAQGRHRFHVKVAREAFKDDREAARTLGLTGQQPKQFSAWLHRAETFYSRALADPEFVQRLTAFGVNQARLEQAQQLVQAAKTAKTVQALRQGEALLGTRQRDAALQALHAWMTPFAQVARLALADMPQALVKLGLVQAARPQASNKEQGPVALDPEPIERM